MFLSVPHRKANGIGLCGYTLRQVELGQSRGGNFRPLGTGDLLLSLKSRPFAPTRQECTKACVCI